jgi:nitrate reductase NapAB chaperone NapD
MTTQADVKTDAATNSRWKVETNGSQIQVVGIMADQVEVGKLIAVLEAQKAVLVDARPLQWPIPA